MYADAHRQAHTDGALGNAPIIMCLLRKKNMSVQGSYSSYILLKSGTSSKSTT
jgi:hypothetical protein